MKTISLFIMVALLVCATSCREKTGQTPILDGWTTVAHRPGDDNDREQRELELRELIFHAEIVQPIRNEVVFLSFGYGEGGNWILPPPGYLDRFQELNVTVRSVEDANLFQEGINSKTDQRRGHVYYVQIVKWLDESTVKLNHGSYGGPLSGGGVDGAVYEFRHGSWQLKTSGQRHIS